MQAGFNFKDIRNSGVVSRPFSFHLEGKIVVGEGRDDHDM